MNWLRAAAYDDRDLARTIENLDSFFNQLLNADGRGLGSESGGDVEEKAGRSAVDVEPPVAVQTQIRVALESLNLSAEGSFAHSCQRLADATKVEGWRMAAAPALESVLTMWVQMAERMRADNPTSFEGSVSAIHVSNGGVPKTAVPSGQVGWRGLDGDRQASRQHHGRPWQAVCLWSVETIASLQREGHPLGPGFAGENITLSGIDFSRVIAGSRLIIGAEVVLDVTITTLPCSKNAQWFVGGHFNRMHHRVEPGVSRMYAAVVHPGSIAVGDVVRLASRS